MGKVLGAILSIITFLVLVPFIGPIGAGIAASVVGYVANSLLGGSAQKPETTEGSIKNQRPPRVSAYGRSRLYGAYVLYVTSSNGTAIDIYAIHDGKLDGIETRYLGDDAMEMLGDFVGGGGDGRYSDYKVSLYTTDGSAPGTAFGTAVGMLPGVWTSSHRGDGVVALALFSAPVSNEKFSEIYPQGVPPTPSLVARWQACPDPEAEDPLDESGWTWTENPVRHLLHYMMVREFRPELPKADAGYAAALRAMREEWWARKIAPTLEYWIAAAQDCELERALSDGGTEARYRSCVSHKHTDKHQATKAAILATFDGWMATRADGAYVIYSGRYYAPTVTIGPDEIVSYTWQGGGVDDDEAVNHLVCSYVSSLHAYATVECDPWRDDTDIGNRGQELSESFDPAVPSHAQARYLAKRVMARRNAVNRGTVTTNIAGRIARGQRFIWLHLAEGNAVFYDGPAEITALSRTLSGGVTFEWVQADPNIDNWNPATEEGEPAAVGSEVALESLATPTIDSAAAIYDGASVRLQVQVNGPDRSDLTWYAHWRLAGASVWGADEAYSDADDGSAIILNTSVVPSNASVEVQVAYLVGDGRRSEWSSTTTVSTALSALAPSNVTSLAATGGTGSAGISWRNPTSSNLGYVRLYRSATSSFSGAAQIGGDVSGGLGEVMSATYSGAAGTHYFWARPYSSAGVAGTLSGPVSAVIT
ncbi:hypothetical protein GTZ99_12495 [Novosphingobium sp. FSY-8]|uniref:Tail protein n=1 Tax=Novosphingobium ovatum TaxID=1908523 RepID=A0ABW9XFQ1_9SPHN|nr:hypothetical protein [Novosphingobium ovatum]NBC37370.1 hypothetical protein [Novosphingobium ovatum]